MTAETRIFVAIHCNMLLPIFTKCTCIHMHTCMHMHLRMRISHANWLGLCLDMLKAFHVLALALPENSSLVHETYRIAIYLLCYSPCFACNYHHDAQNL